MRLHANGRRRRATAAFVLLTWLMALFVNIAHACVLPPPSSLLEAPPAMLEAAAAPAVCPPADSGCIPNTCDTFCDRQASAMSKEKSVDATSLDHSFLVIPAYVVPLLSRTAPVLTARETCSLSHDPIVSLRSTRLTL